MVFPPALNRAKGDVLFQSQGNNPGLPTPSPILVQRQRMLLLGMLRKGSALAETLGKPELEPWTLGVKTASSVEWGSLRDPGSSGPEAPLAVASQGPPSATPAESEAHSNPFLSDTVPNAPWAPPLPKGATA